MIYELRTYTFHPGRHVKYLELVEQVGAKIRGSDYGKREGSWIADTGHLNQVWHLWSYDSLDERAHLRAELARNDAWMNDFVAEIKPLLRRQEVRFMNAAVPLKPPADSGNIYEIRIYRTSIAGVREWVSHFTDILPVREKYSANVGLFTVESPEPNGVVHIWSYPDWNARAETRAEVAADPEWQGFLGKGGPLLEEMYSTICVPAPFSPMR